MSICSIHYLGRKRQVGFKWTTPSFKHLISCCQLGVSAFVGEISYGMTAIVFNFLILDIAGNPGLAAYSVVTNLAIVAIAIFNGLAQGAQPLISIFNSENNAQLLNYAHTGLRLYFLGFIVAGINVVLRGIVAIVICAVILAKLFGVTCSRHLNLKDFEVGASCSIAF